LDVNYCHKYIVEYNNLSDTHNIVNYCYKYIVEYNKLENDTHNINLGVELK